MTLYHTIQHTKAIIQHSGEARDDYKIIQALANVLYVTYKNNAKHNKAESLFTYFEETIYP